MGISKRQQRIRRWLEITDGQRQLHRPGKDNELQKCECGNDPRLVMFYVKGVANLVNWFVKCDTCRIRTRRRNKPQKAINEWNENRGALYDGYVVNPYKEANHE